MNIFFTCKIKMKKASVFFQANSFCILPSTCDMINVQQCCLQKNGLLLIKPLDYNLKRAQIILFIIIEQIMSPSIQPKDALKLIIFILMITASLQQIVYRNLGCKSFKEGVCTSCSLRYYLDLKKICQPVNPNCNAYDAQTGDCLSCFPGFGLLEGTCLPGIVTSTFDPNCNQFKGDKCAKCSIGFYLGFNGKCQAADPSCKTFNDQNGQCLSCFSGFQVSTGKCIVSQTQSAIANCNQVDLQSGKCIKCSFGYYFDSNGNCLQADPNCKLFNTALFKCTDCYPGYSLTLDNQCIKSQTPQGDPNCAKYDPNNNCLECSKGAIFNLNKICIVIDPSCLTFDSQTGRCTSCYPGYTIQSDTASCVLASIAPNSNPYCAKWKGSYCQSCALGSYFNSDRICIVADVNCKLANGAQCISCYDGYTLLNNSCIKSAEDPSSNSLCALWQGKICKKCSSGTYLNKGGLCIVVNPLCMTHDSTNGSCLSCYIGYSLSEGECFSSNTSTPSDPFCRKFLTADVCSQCSDRYYVGTTGICTQVSSNCNTFNKVTGSCLSCYLGFSLTNGNCLEGNSSTIDPNCAAFSAGVCVRCSKNFYFGINGACQAVNPLCQTFDPSNGNCLTCYQSFALSNGVCIEDKNNTSTDPNCAAWLSGICTSCASRTFMNNAGLCQGVNINCNTYNINTGDCTSCYSGFALTNGSCSISASPDSCSKVDSQGKCVKCGQGSYLSQGQCLTIDTQCASFDTESQSCQSCYPGYSILNGVCQISKVDSQFAVQNCYAYDNNSQCIKCFDRFYLSQNTCEPVNVFCKTYDDNTGNCLSCYSTFTLSNGYCSQ